MGSAVLQALRGVRAGLGLPAAAQAAVTACTSSSASVPGAWQLPGDLLHTRGLHRCSSMAPRDSRVVLGRGGDSASTSGRPSYSTSSGSTVASASSELSEVSSSSSSSAARIGWTADAAAGWHPLLDQQRGTDLPRLVTKQRLVPMPLADALELVQNEERSRALAKTEAHAAHGRKWAFDATVEAHIRLKVDPRRGDQMVRGATIMPFSVGKPVRICVFAEGEAADEARAAGADIVGDAALVASILESKGKALDFDTCLAHPDMMKSLVVLGKILGPKKLMPNPKVGTLTTDLAGAIAAARRGRLEFKMDRAATVHAPIGKVSQAPAQVYMNMGALLKALMVAKPEAIKGGLGRYIRRVVVCTTRGGAREVDLASIPAAIEAATELQQQQQQEQEEEGAAQPGSG